MELKSLFNSPRRNGENNRKRRNDQRCRNKCSQCNTSPASREFATDNPVLTLKVAVEAYYKNEDGDADKRGPEGFSNAPEARGCRSSIN